MEMRVCPVCKKRFHVQWPHLWAYRRESTFFCSWKCLRAFDKTSVTIIEGMEVEVKRAKVTLEQKKKAVQIALEGGDPLAYLRKFGVKDATNMWWNIKQDLKEKDPDTFEKLPKRIQRKDAKIVVKDGVEYEKAEPDMPEVHTVEAAAKIVQDHFGVKVESPERAVKLTGPVVIDPPKGGRRPLRFGGLTVRCLEGKFGRYTYNKTAQGEYIDFETADGMETVSNTIGEWGEFIEELRHAGHLLGVEI